MKIRSINKWNEKKINQLGKNSKNRLILISSSYHFIRIFLNDFIDSISQTYELSIFTNLKIEKETKFNSNYIHIPIQRKISVISDFISIIICIFRFIKNRPNYLITVTPKAIIFGSILKFLFIKSHRTHIYTGITWTNMRGFKKIFFIFLDRINIFFSDLILFDSKEQILFFKENNLISSKFKLIHNGSIKGVDTKIFYSFDNIIKNSLRKKFGIKEEAKVILYMGRMDQEKGIQDLIESYKYIHSKRKNIILLLVGKDEMNVNSYLKNLNFEIRNKIIYLEHSESPHEILNIANIFCLPSKREGFGNSVIESSACEVPVVGSNIFGLNSSLIDEYNGLIFEVNNIRDLSLKLLKLIDDKYFCMRLGKNGRSYVVKNFEKNDVINSLNKLITKNYV